MGLYIFESNDSVVAGNVISSVSETAQSTGIQVQQSSLIEVRNNTVLGTQDATFNLGIAFNNATDVTIIGNRILNPTGTGTTGIIDLFMSSGVNCIANLRAAYTTPIGAGACDFVAGNRPP